jgi:two-component system, OmpR family, sensor kinase
VLVLAIVALEVPLATSVARRVDAEVSSQALAQADVVAATVADLLGPGERSERQRLVDVAAANVRGRVIVTDARGRLIADSEDAPAGRSYAGRQEVSSALRGRREQLERRSETLGEKLLVTAVPVVSNGRRAGVVRVSQSVGAVDRTVRRAWVGLALIGLLVLGLGLLVGSLVAGQIARPVLRLDRAARKVAEGDLSARADIEGSAEQRSLARTFNDMTARLERLVRSQRDFVADASHQLRTPLTGLRLRVEAARSETTDPEAAADLDGALGELDRLAQMVDELLELSRAGEPGAGGEELELVGLARAAAARWSPTAAKRGQRVSAAADGAAGSVWLTLVDADRILDALVENALNYSPAGSAVEIVARAGGVAVRDRGKGLAPEERDQVFERFARGSAGRRGVPGTGLGLPIARELARRWGGDVTLSPREGGGTVAEVALPPARGAFAGS